MLIKKLSLIAMLALGLTSGLSSAALAESSKVDLGAAPALKMTTREVVMVGKVVSIDTEKRTVTLEAENGDRLITDVNPKIRNLDKLKLGDKVETKYYRTLVWKPVEVTPQEAKEKTTLIKSTTTGLPSDKPTLKESTETKFIATVDSVDKSKRSAVFKGPQGNTMEVRIEDSNMMKDLKVGDQISVEITRTIAVAVRKA